MNLSVSSFDVSVTVNDPSITANESTASYQWLDCDNSYAPITNEISQSFTALVNGNYAVIITQGICSDTSDCIQITSLGIFNTITNGIVIYPNPVKNKLTIEYIGNINKLDFEILNSIGQVIYKGNLFEKTVVTTASFSPGVYLIKLESGKTFEFKKIVKE